MKKKISASFLALAMCFSLQSMPTFAAGNFEDVPADAALTRDVTVDTLYRSAGSPDTSGLTNPFNDVPEEGLYADAVKWAAANQIVSGYGGGKFGPEDNITRQDFAVMASRCLNLLNPNVALTQQYIIFADEADIADYAKNAAQDIIKLGIIKTTETNVFNPKGTITGAEAASMFRSFDEIAVPNQSAPADTKIKAADSLLSEFVTDETAATEIYTEQEVVFIGAISETARPKDNAPETDVCYIVFNHFIDWNEDDGVMCYFDSLVVDSVKAGDTVMVKGNFRGYADNGVFKTLTLGECELLEVTATAAPEMVAESLFFEFVTDEAAATETYTGQDVVITGTVSETARPKDNVPETDVCYIVFNHFDGLNENDGVMCYFDSFVVDSVKVGDAITVKGNFRSYEDNGVFKTLTLGECELVQEP
jgi:hypothetical protein